MDTNIKIVFDWKPRASGEFFKITYFIGEDYKKELEKKNVEYKIKNSDYHKFKSRNPTSTDGYNINFGNHVPNVWKKARVEDFGFSFEELKNKDERDNFLTFFHRELINRIKNINTRNETTSSIEVQICEVDGTNELSNDNLLSFVNFSLPQFMILNGETYKIHLEKLKNRKSLVGLGKTISNKLHDMYSNQAGAIQQVLSEEIETLTNDLTNERTNAFICGLNAFQKLQNEGWIIQDDKLFFPGRIKAELIRESENLYSFKSEEDNIFYIEGISIPIANKVIDAFAKKAFHPNSQGSENTKLCLGDLTNKPILVFVERIKQLFKVINMNSTFGNSADYKVDELFSGNKLEFKSKVSVWRSR